MKTLLLFATPLGLDDDATHAPGLLDLRFAQFFAPWALLRNPFGIADLGIDDLVFPDVVVDEDFTFIRNPLGVGRRCDACPGLLDLRFAQFFAPWALLRNPFGIADLGIDDLVFPDVVVDEDFTFIRNPVGVVRRCDACPGLLDLRFAQFFAPWALLRNPFGIADLGIDDLVFPDVVVDEDFTFIRNPLGVGRRCDACPRVARPALRAVLRTLGFASQSLWDCPISIQTTWFSRM